MTERPAGGSRGVVDARGLAVRLGGRTILDGVDLRAEPGQLVALLGANGSGKTTLFRALLGLVPPSAGAVTLDGVDVLAASGRARRRLRSRVGFVPQRLGLVGPLSALGNVLLGGLGRRGTWGSLTLTAPASARREAMAALGRVGLADRAAQRTATLSGGQQQRVAIARMLVQRPAVVLADEPVASLDPAAATSIMALLRRLADEDRLAVVVTLHQLDHVAHAADEVAGLRDGRVLFSVRADAFDAERADLLYRAPEPA
jgi:phosphonate transport system ATP-binding protein